MFDQMKEHSAGQLQGRTVGMDERFHCPVIGSDMAAKGIQQGGPELHQEVTTEVFRSRTQWGHGKPLPDIVVLYDDGGFVTHGFQVGEMRQSFGKANGDITPESQCWW